MIWPLTFSQTIHFLIFETTRFLTPEIVATEWVVVILAAVLIAAIPNLSLPALSAVRDRFLRLARNKRASIGVCCVLPVAVRLAMLGFAPVPDPSIHDEFSHLLLGDTFAHGRLTNPTHPMWVHFETIHVIQRPTYNSMYPPGQGAFLALGEVIFHEPWAGVVISVALMCGALCWMLQGWLPAGWALFGALLAILKIGITGPFMNSYLAGAVPAIGGALLLGSLPRLRRNEFRPLHGALLGIGLVLLMNTRPVEGALLGTAALIYLLKARWRRWWKEKRRVTLTLVLPAGALLACGMIFTGYYCWRVTGSPVRMPYQVNRDTYGWPENLAFLAPKKLVLRHPLLQAMYTKEIHNRDAYSSGDRILDSLGTRFFDNWTVLIGPLLTVPLILLPWVWRDRRTHILVVFLCLIGGFNLFQLVLYPYHLGPVVPAIFAVATQAVRHLYVNLKRVNRRIGLSFACVLPLGLFLIGTLKQEAADLGIPMSYWESAMEPHREARAEIDSWLSRRPKQQLVIVKYDTGHSPNQEWVYNHADIDRSKVIWARDMGVNANAELLRYFSNREAWLLRPDAFPPRVVRYRAEDDALPESTSPEAAQP